jgi:hypothetical protein
MPDITINDRKYSAQEWAEIRNAFIAVEKHNASGTADTHNPAYGPYADGSGDYGTFSYPGIRPEMFSSFARPRSLSSIVGVRQSRIANEKIGIMTGVTAEEGSNPSDFCGLFPTAGQLKRCVQNYPWGKSAWKTKVVNIAEAGEYADYTDIAAKRILNMKQSNNQFVPDLMNRLDISNRDAATLAVELGVTGVAMDRAFERVLVTGNRAKAPAAAQLGFFKEFDGLERQITTGRVDMDTGVACPGADSIVINWGTGIDASVGGRTFQQAVVDTYFALKVLAEDVGLDGVTWAIGMRMEMFRALTYIWACEYYVSRCQGSAGNPSYTDASEVRKLQLQMWDGRYLLIDDEPVRVIFSDGIPMTKAGNNVYTAQDFFIIPIDWMGQPLLNIQYKVMNNADAMSFAEFIAPNEFAAYNNGMWLGTKQRTGYCMELLFAGKFRLVLDAPFLAAVINTMQFTYQAPTRSAYPDVTEFYRDGGATRWDGNYTVS